MRLLVLAFLFVTLADASAIQGLMQDAFYPVLFGILVLASLGLPIPEDIPLIAAGVLLHQHPGIATWTGTFFVALVGIMIGDLVLYNIGRVWGPDVVRHRLVRRVVTQRRFRKASEQFHRHGMWFCFFGRFLMGVRAAMCMTAGALRFPYWRFFLADFCGALLSVPFFVYLGYWFAGMIPSLRAYMTGVQWILLAVGLFVVTGIVYYKYHKILTRRAAIAHAATRLAETQRPAAAAPNVNVPAEAVTPEPPAEQPRQRLPAEVDS